MNNIHKSILILFFFLLKIIVTSSSGRDQKGKNSPENWTCLHSRSPECACFAREWRSRRRSRTGWTEKQTLPPLTAHTPEEKKFQVVLFGSFLKANLLLVTFCKEPFNILLLPNFTVGCLAISHKEILLNKYKIQNIEVNQLCN